MSTLWLLVFIAGHSYTTVPGISSQAECERLFITLQQAGWTYTRGTTDHQCISYRAG